MITGGTTTMAALHRSRQNTYRAITVGLVLVMLLKYSLKLIDIGSNCCGHKYVQLWNGGRTSIDKMLESMMIHGMSLIFTLSMQLTLCTLFLTFWEGEYFIMSYIPGIGFVAFFISFFAFVIVMVMDRMKGWFLNATNRFIYFFWFCWTFWNLMVAVPMIGYSVYVAQFVIQALAGGYIRDEPFSPEFVNASRTVCKAVGVFVGINLVELLIILRLDIESSKVHK